jgi:hypothetical protein
MPSETDDGRHAPRTVSRRNLFKQVAVVGNGEPPQVVIRPPIPLPTVDGGGPTEERAARDTAPSDFARAWKLWKKQALAK